MVISVLLVAVRYAWPAPRLLSLASFTTASSRCVVLRLDEDVIRTGLLLSLAVGAFLGGLWRGLWLGPSQAFKVSDFPGCFGGPAIHARPR